MACSVKKYRGKPVIFTGSSPEDMPSYCGCAPGHESWLDTTRRFARYGRKVFWIMPKGGYNGEWGTTPFWTGPGEINCPPKPMPASYFGLDQQAAAILEIVPDARFIVRMMDMPPQSWYVAHPDAVPHNCLGQRMHGASLASDDYIAEVGDFLKALTRHCERSAWASRVIGYIIYPLGEGGTDLAMRGYLFEYSSVMERAYRQFLARKYGTDDALRAAWHDASAAIDTAAVPRDDDFRARSDAPVMFWPEARQVQPERDYFELQQILFRRYIKALLDSFREAAGPNRLCGIDALKGNMLGWMCHSIFAAREWKEHYGDWILATGTAGMAEILDWDNFDIVATPHDYRNRWAGYGFDPEAIGDSVVLHGKLMLVEEDQRSYASPERGLFGSIEPGEEQAVVMRNLAASLTRGQQNYPMDVYIGYFQSDAVQEAYAKAAAISGRMLHVDRRPVPGVAMLVDDRAGICTDFSAEYNDLAVIRQRIHGMNHCGVPASTLLFDDLRRDDFPVENKLYLLPNCYRWTDEIAHLIRRKLCRNGNVIVFGPGSGITDGTTVSPEFASKLMGFQFELYDYEYPRFVTVDNFYHPITAAMGAHEMYGDSLRYGPVLVPRIPGECEATQGIRPRRCEQTSANSVPPVRLGTIALDNGKRLPGLVVKEFGKGASGNGTPGPRGEGDYAVVFTTAVPLPAGLLRSLARHSGTHVYDDVDDVVFADSASVAVHAVKPGPRLIALPREHRVEDMLTGEVVGDCVSRITFDVEKPVTRWWILT